MSVAQQIAVAPTTGEIVGEQESGSRSEEVRRRINKLIKAVNTNMFDLADYLHEVKTKAYYTEWGFTSYGEYAKSLKIKYSRAYYLVDIVETMRLAGVSRAEYEPAGPSKLRVIVGLRKAPGLAAEFNGAPVKDLVRELTLKADQMSLEEVKAEVDKIQGKVEDDSMVWVNLHVKKIARENVIKPALALAKKHIGSVGTDDDGNAVDASDSAAAEMIFANFLSDPNFNSEAPKPSATEKLYSLLKSMSLPAGTTISELTELLETKLMPQQEETPQED